MAVTTHMCRGNLRSSGAARGGNDFAAEALSCELAVAGFFPAYDDSLPSCDERSAGPAPRSIVPSGKMAVLGPVTTRRRPPRARLLGGAR